jgi:hypothetical protein
MMQLSPIDILIFLAKNSLDEDIYIFDRYLFDFLAYTFEIN